MEHRQSSVEDRGSKDNPRFSPSELRWYLAVGTLLVVAIIVLVFATTRSLSLRFPAILVLAWFLPGLLLATHLQPTDTDVVTAGLLAVGLGWCWMVLIVLGLHWIPGPIGYWPMIATYGVGALGLVVALLRRCPRLPRPVPKRVALQFALLLVVALALRVPGLGSEHEFYHDETFMLVRARDAVRGMDDALARHTKGSGEIAASIVVYRALNTTTETTARLPFALMGVAAVLATADVGRRLFSPTVGWWAGVLLAVNGFALALSRIAQYQGAILMLMALAVLAGVEFSRTQNTRWLVLTIVFTAFGLVMHYELILAAPALLLLLWRGWQRAERRRRLLRVGVPVSVAATMLVGVVYLSLVLSSFFSQSTQYYYAARFGNPGNNNVPFFIDISTLYNSVYFAAGLVILVAAGLVIGWRARREATVLLTLWFAPYLIVYLFVIPVPGTHFYMMMESWSLLAALPLVALVHRARLPQLRWTAGAVTVCWVALSIGYLYLALLRPWPQYLINFREMRHPLYWVPYEIPFAEKPRVGIPHREGWKTLGVMREWGYFLDTYASNEEHTRWYLGDFDDVGFDEQPDFIFVAHHPMELNSEYDPAVVEQYRRVGEVQVHGERRIEIFSREPLAVPYAVYEAERFDRVFDNGVAVLEEWPEPPAQTLAVPLGDAITLRDARLRRTRWARGKTLHLLLHWQPRRPLEREYKLFVHVGADDAGQPLTQWDGYPGLNTIRTSRVSVDDTVRDHVLIELPPTMPTGDHPVVAGFYDAETGARLGGRAVPIATITVR